MTDRGRLYLVPNALDVRGAAMLDEAASLDDLLPRGVLKVAARLEHWVVENARSARAFLKRVEAVVPLERPLQALSLVELPRQADRVAGLLAPIEAGHDLGLLSEAGLPALADPGAAVVALAHDAGHEVVVLPGASAIPLALAASGLEGQRFAFVGYVPAAAEARAAALRRLEADSRRDGRTQVLIETPYRNAALLETMLTTLAPATKLSVSVGLTLPSGRTTMRSVGAWRTSEIRLPDDVPAVFAFLAG